MANGNIKFEISDGNYIQCASLLRCQNQLLLTLYIESEASRSHSCCIRTGDLVHSRVIPHCVHDGDVPC